MADKNSEASYVERLRGIWPDFPTGPRTTSENPDFLVRGQHQTVGIEVTSLTLQPDGDRQPTRELLSVRRQIVAQALAKYRAAAGPVLIVDIEFIHIPISSFASVIVLRRPPNVPEADKRASEAAASPPHFVMSFAAKLGVGG